MTAQLVNAITVAVAAATGNARVFVVKNNCPYTIWPAIYTDSSTGPPPNHTTGWEAPPGRSVRFTVPNDWKSGRIWGRTGCYFDKDPGPSSCITGGCVGGLECTQPGTPPAAVAEWTLQGDRDFYDVSLVDGSNVPMSITNDVGCPIADCPVDLNGDCPAPLRGPSAPDGNNAGCTSACFANLDGNPTDSANCCSGTHNTTATCPSSGVQFYDYFKSRCNNSHAYAFDEKTNTCDSRLKASYT
ncbi:hypothetical protein E1B28_002026 [Marasmius oreades]|uniref:Thaumatin-like protein n=1 Tax=Marasmius oreades TaxID=181124 RepID=A0A9P7V4L2_9AGAR|nr:uncharacterized protein E1B28_002026 [Marasmius oreades]KAG7100254.1 hypothetical protein E1B28_002026 [Marasmius oreades]